MNQYSLDNSATPPHAVENGDNLWKNLWIKAVGPVLHAAARGRVATHLVHWI
jgi:hypothetical protein